MSRLARVSRVELAEKYSVWIDFSNGERKLVDLQLCCTELMRQRGSKQSNKKPWREFAAR